MPGDWILKGIVNTPIVDPGWAWFVYYDVSNYHMIFNANQYFWVGYKRSQTNPPWGCADGQLDYQYRNAYKTSPTGNWQHPYEGGDYIMEAVITKGYPTYWPISGETTLDDLCSAFGPRLLSGEYDFHRGIDIVASYVPVYAIESG
ncbi:unnamed protein product, partial [marine sediment metagenome]